jgi:hypothetical protein
MRILILNQYAPPDPAPTAKLVSEIAAALAQDGHAVTIVGTNQDYRRARSGREIRLFRQLRALAQLFFKGLGCKRPALKRAKSDLYPELAFALGWRLPAFGLMRLRQWTSPAWTAATPTWSPARCGAQGLRSLLRVDGEVSQPLALAAARSLRRELLSHHNGPCPAESSLAELLGRAGKLDPVNRVSYLEMRSYMANMLLRDTDCTSIGARAGGPRALPRHRLVEYALSISGSMKLYKRTPKHLLVKVMQELLPDEIVYRPASPCPSSIWLRHELKPGVERVMALLGDGPLAGVLQPQAVRGVWQSFLEGKTSWARL